MFLISLALGAFCSGRPRGEAARHQPVPRPSAERVAAYFHRPVEDVLDLRRRGFGYGEIVKILTIAQLSKRPISELLDENRSGYGWGTISRQWGLSAVSVKKKVDRARRDLNIRVRQSP